MSIENCVKIFYNIGILTSGKNSFISRNILLLVADQSSCLYKMFQKRDDARKLGQTYLS